MFTIKILICYLYEDLFIELSCVSLEVGITVFEN